jgi:thymidylate kinase
VTVAANRGPGLVVELAGLPGSGKSRRTRRLAEVLAERGVPVRDPREGLTESVPTGPRLARKAVRACAAALASPLSTARFARGLLRSGQPAGAELTGRLVQWLVTQDVLARGHRAPGVSIVDEGQVQALWSIGLRGDVDPVLEALAAAPPPSAADLLVVVRVPPDVALARLARRRSRHSRTQLLTEDARRAEIERGNRLLDHLVRWWTTERDTAGQVVTLDGTSDDPAELLELVELIRSSDVRGQGPLDLATR